MLTMRETPKMSDRPAATRNSPEAVERPLTAWNRNALSDMVAQVRSPLLTEQARRGEKPDTAGLGQFASAGRSFFTSASDGSTVAPSTYLMSLMVPLPFSSAIVPT